MQLCQRDPQLLADLEVHGLSAQAALDPADCLLDGAEFLSQDARRPVLLAEAVEHRAPNALLGVGLEAHASAGVVACCCVEEADHGGALEVVQIDVRGELRRHQSGDAPDLREVGYDHLLPLVIRTKIPLACGAHKLGHETPLVD
jgi:hypothetical protein